MAISSFIDCYIKNRLIGFGPEHNGICPSEGLSENQLEQLKDQLTQLIPTNSMILDLHVWDIHFDEYLDDDWFFEAALGKPETAEWCSEQIKEFSLEQVNEFDLDYDQHEDPEMFESLVRAEALEFIKGWRENIAKGFGKALPKKNRKF